MPKHVPDELELFPAAAEAGEGYRSLNNLFSPAAARPRWLDCLLVTPTKSSSRSAP